MKLQLLPFILLMFFIACHRHSEHNIVETSKNEILTTERKFAEMSEKEGILKAFLFYAAEDAVLMRNNKLVKGKKSLRSYFEENEKSNNEISLTWSPDFVEVSKSGDLGYTYGNYVVNYTDSLGVVTSEEGIFHTVWKKQKNGDWRFVWD